jgi:hypothetical protein
LGVGHPAVGVVAAAPATGETNDLTLAAAAAAAAADALSSINTISRSLLPSDEAEPRAKGTEVGGGPGGGAHGGLRV